MKIFAILLLVGIIICDQFLINEYKNVTSKMLKTIKEKNKQLEFTKRKLTVLEHICN